MQIPLYQIDAFTKKPFAGNPAAVCPLTEWLDDRLLQQIATENNLSETAFIVRSGDMFEIRWFTPLTEVDLCGHATLAAAYVLWQELDCCDNELRFSSRSGELRVFRNGTYFTLDFPAVQPRLCVDLAESFRVQAALGIQEAIVLRAEDYIVVVESEQRVREIEPNFDQLMELPLRGVAVTARGQNVDFVSRWFGPKVGVDEDPVTGSAHTALAPYWAEQLNKRELSALQCSRRGGELHCELVDDRVHISGHAVKFMSGMIVLQHN